MVFTSVISVAALLGFVSCNAFFVGQFNAPLRRSPVITGERRCQPIVRSEVRSTRGSLRMAGFGGGKAKKPKETAPKLTSGEAVQRIALKEYTQLKRDGGAVAKVHARLKGTEEWFPVGSVCTQPGKTAEGTQGQKRLILEHAAEMYDQLRSGAGKTLVLEVGYTSEQGDEIIVCKAKYSGEEVGVALDPLPNGPFFRDVAKASYAKDSSSAATLLDKAKYT